MLVGAVAAAVGAATSVGAVHGVRTGITPLFTRSGTYTRNARGWWGRVVAAFYLVCGMGLLVSGIAILAGRLAL